MVTSEMLWDCIDNPVKSDPHDWQEGEQAEYNALKARGRSLYDGLRTKYNVSHADALYCATLIFGRKK